MSESEARPVGVPWPAGERHGPSRVIGGLIWLAFIVFPLISAIGEHNSPLGNVLVIGGAAAFVAIYAYMVVDLAGAPGQPGAPGTAAGDGRRRRRAHLRRQLRVGVSVHLLRGVYGGGGTLCARLPRSPAVGGPGVGRHRWSREVGPAGRSATGRAPWEWDC